MNGILNERHINGYKVFVESAYRDGMNSHVKNTKSIPTFRYQLPVVLNYKYH